MRLGFLGTYVKTQHDDTGDVVGRGVIPLVHDQHLWVTETRLSIDAGLTERFAVSVALPLRVVSTSIRYLDGSGMPVELVTPNIHHRNETLSGLGDPMLLGAVSEPFGAFRLTVRAGMSLPLGRTERDPFAMPDVPHEHIQMGTGTINPIAALEGTYGWARWRLAAFAFTQQIVYENSKGYQAGDRYATGIALRRALGRFGVRSGIELQAESRERWNGIVHKDEGNQGRIDAMVAVGGSVSVGAGFSVDLAVKIPFVTHVVGGQLDMPALVEVGVARSFGGGGEHAHHHHEHGDEHDHEHGDEHEHAEAAPLDTTGADVADVGTAGEAVDLVPVAGKITIFDFWAPWCEPCKRLEPVLVELAKRDPAHVALRRIDVVDWESPVVARYLTPRAFDLPHVKIFDGKGTLVLEQSSGPGKLVQLIDAIRAVVGGAPAATPSVVAPAGKVYSITASEKGFEPGTIRVTHGVPVTLRFKRVTENTCATEVSFQHDGQSVLRELPLNLDVDVTVTFDKPGTVTYSCAMGMLVGSIVVD